MFKPESIPADVAEEVKALLGSLMPEPEALVKKRQRLVAELDKQVKATSGTLAQLMQQVRAVLLSLQPQAPLELKLAEDFAKALERYVKDTAAPKPPPALLNECMAYMRERVEAMGLGTMLVAVESSAAQVPAAVPRGVVADGFSARPQQAGVCNAGQAPGVAGAADTLEQQAVHTRVMLGNTRA